MRAVFCLTDKLKMLADFSMRAQEKQKKPTS